MQTSQTKEVFEAITRRIYGVISAPPAERRWEDVRGLYHPRATMVRTGVDDDGKPFVLAMTFDEYVANVSDKLADVAFSETEVSLQVDVFGNVARLASVYEYTLRAADATQHGRGVNFFNLVNEGHGWKIMNIVWDNEREGISLETAGLAAPGK